MKKIKDFYSKRQPYGEWLDHNLYPLKELKVPNKRPYRNSGEQLERLQRHSAIHMKAFTVLCCLWL